MFSAIWHCREVDMWATRLRYDYDNEDNNNNDNDNGNDNNINVIEKRTRTLKETKGLANYFFSVFFFFSIYFTKYSKPVVVPMCFSENRSPIESNTTRTTGRCNRRPKVPFFYDRKRKQEKRISRE
ncbi:uncharacterized protein LOC118446407 [Vespa mandarinia]|uniref:uncharacterized protein LOC118446407 n=1 Tax=Vespa mandarinia TaxID=7446 RepID=UPI00161D8339|nr:uncharacterized protein LOC118446407 [Vespa mandarinia]